MLDCPECRSGFGLVAFVDEAVARRVVAGRLGCPLCEIEYPIRSGTIDFDPSGAGSSPGSLSDRPAPPDRAVRLAALLGLTDPRDMVVLLGPGLSEVAIELARMSDRLEVLTWLDREVEPDTLTRDERSAGVNPIRGASSASWPVRSGSLHGIAFLGSLVHHLPEAERCARAGGRFVALQPEAQDLERLSSSAFEEVARDDVTWVGQRR